MVSFSGFTCSSSCRTSVMRFTARRFCSTVRPSSMVICTCAIESPVLNLADGASLLRYFESGEEITQLEARGVFGVGPVHRVLLDARRPLLADGAFLRFRGIGGAH